MNGQTARSIAYHHGRTNHADHYVYRCYDSDGTLLYIGCTTDVARRIAGHLGGKSKQVSSRWLAASIDRYEVDGPFDGRDAGRDAEREAIRTEQPLFNLQERRMPGWLLIPSIAEYLIEHGQIELALETACSCTCDDREDGTISSICVPHLAAKRAAA